MDLEKYKELSHEGKLIWAKNSILKKGLSRIEKYNLFKKFTTYQVNDKILIKAYNLSGKFLKRTNKFLAVFEGPYEVKNIVGKGTYIVIDPKNGVERQMFHANEIRKYHLD